MPLDLKEIAHAAKYELTLDQAKGVIAEALGLPASAITVDYNIQEVGADHMDRYPGHPEVTKIVITVDKQKVAT